METEIKDSSHGVDFHSIVVLIVTTIVLGFLFTWDFLVYSTTWTLRSLIGVYIGVHLCCFVSGLLTDDASTASFRWNKQSKLSKKLKEYAKAATVFAISVLFFYLLPILLGVPLLSQCLETLQFSFFLSSILTFPGILTWGGDEIKWLRIVFGTGGQSKWECVWLRSCCFCLCGAWLGAFAIPLDWDRPWQLWPVSSTYGALLGYSLGLAYNLQRHHTNNQQRKFV